MLIIHVFESSGLVFIDLWWPVMSRIDSFCWFLSCLPTFFSSLPFVHVGSEKNLLRSVSILLLSFYYLLSFALYTCMSVFSLYSQTTCTHTSKSHQNYISFLFGVSSVVTSYSLSQSTYDCVQKSIHLNLMVTHQKKHRNTEPSRDFFFLCNDRDKTTDQNESQLNQANEARLIIYLFHMRAGVSVYTIQAKIFCTDYWLCVAQQKLRYLTCNFFFFEFTVCDLFTHSLSLSSLGVCTLCMGFFLSSFWQLLPFCCTNFCTFAENTDTNILFSSALMWYYVMRNGERKIGIDYLFSSLYHLRICSTFIDIRMIFQFLSVHFNSYEQIIQKSIFAPFSLLALPRDWIYAMELVCSADLLLLLGFFSYVVKFFVGLVWITIQLIDAVLYRFCSKSI